MFVVGGGCLIDLVSASRAPGETITMQAHPGGSPYNCAIALSRLGNTTGYLCPISKDGFGTYLLEPLQAAGVQPLLESCVDAPTTLAVVTLNAKGEAAYEFYRGADRAFTREGLIGALPGTIQVYQIGGFCPIEPTDAAVWADVVRQARRSGAVISFDPNVRPSLVSDFSAYRTRLETFFDLAHIIKMSEDDMQALRPGVPVQTHSADLLSRYQCELVVVTLGEKGSMAFTRAGQGQAGIWAPPVFGDTVGAGDSLMAGILSRLAETGALAPGKLGNLGAARLNDVLQFGAVVAGLNCQHKGCNPPTRAQVDAVLNSRSRI